MGGTAHGADPSPGTLRRKPSSCSSSSSPPARISNLKGRISNFHLLQDSLFAILASPKPPPLTSHISPLTSHLSHLTSHISPLTSHRLHRPADTSTHPLQPPNPTPHSALYVAEYPHPGSPGDLGDSLFSAGFRRAYATAQE
jgi:hypothetical protein